MNQNLWKFVKTKKNRDETIEELIKLTESEIKEVE
jgi:hypothetical protein